MSADKEFEKEMLLHVPKLKAYAISKCKNLDRVSDLVQETMLRVWENKEAYRPGSSMIAWMIVILRNLYFSECRKRNREVEDVDGCFSQHVSMPPEQYGKIELQEVWEALRSIPKKQAEALYLIGAGMSYDEAAVICECFPGTVKSRVNRGRALLAEAIGQDPKSYASARAEDVSTY